MAIILDGSWLLHGTTKYQIEYCSIATKQLLILIYGNKIEVKAIYFKQTNNFVYIGTGTLRK